MSPITSSHHHSVKQMADIFTTGHYEHDQLVIWTRSISVFAEGCHCWTKTKETNTWSSWPESYQPISNLSFKPKLIERFAVNHFNSHTNLVSYFQYISIRQSHFTETAVNTLHNDIARVIDSERVSSLALLDLCVTFDTVDHCILMDVLSSRFGVVDQVHEWTIHTSRVKQRFLHSGWHFWCSSTCM